MSSPTKWTRAAKLGRIRHVLRRDTAEPAIVAALRHAGWVVEKVSSRGFPDLLCARAGRIVLLEVKGRAGVPGKKDKKGKVEKAQAALHLRLRTGGVVVALVTTPQEALDAVEGRAVRDASSVPGGKHLVAVFAAADRALAERLARSPGPATRAVLDEARAMPATFEDREVPDGSPRWAPPVKAARQGKGGRR